MATFPENFPLQNAPSSGPLLWILSEDPQIRRRFPKVLRQLSPEAVRPRELSSRAALEKELIRSLSHLPPALPDLLIADEIFHEDLSALLTRLRAYRPVDLLPLGRSLSPEKLIRLRQLGAWEILLLPVTDQRLREALSRWLRSRRYLKERYALTQDTADRYLSSLSPAAAPGDGQGSLSSGTGEPVLSEVRRQRLHMLHRLLLHYPEGLTVDEAMTHLSCSETTLRGDLTLLSKLGLAKPQADLHGRRGRPAVRYFALTESSQL